VAVLAATGLAVVLTVPVAAALVYSATPAALVVAIVR